jgi:hypothetical protein
LTRLERICSRICGRHSIAVETAAVAGLYAAYESARGLVAGSRASAIDRAHEVVHLERHLHVFEEPRVHDAVLAIPGLMGSLGFAYLTLHLLVTGSVLAWLYYRRPAAFPAVRTTLLVASALSLIGFLAFPTAPPRLADTALWHGQGIVDINHGLISSLYNPYAAVPSMHIGYAVIVGTAVVRYARSRWLRIAGVLYPLFVLLVIVATGNHFFFDAAMGAVVAGAAAVVTTLCIRNSAQAEVVSLEAFRHAQPGADDVRRAA